MGTDISGVVECRVGQTDADRSWQIAADASLRTVGRDYDAFGCLFGVRNYANFTPLAAGRGLPDDVSEPVRAEIEQLAASDPVFGTTWISWAELAAVDWDEKAPEPDGRLHQYRQTDDGLTFIGKSAWSRDFADAVGYEFADVWPEGSEWLVGDVLYRAQSLRRSDAVPADGGWQPVWDAMERLAAVHGEHNVRLVVWFDN